MTLTKRGKIATGVAVGVAVVVVGLGALALTDHAPAPLQRLVDTVVGRPTPCPLTGEVLGGDRDAPARPVIAVKVGNTEAAYPLSGLNDADVVYEELVEGGITRFVALYQCRDSLRVGPIRSGRTTDPRILVQYADPPILGYSGASGPVNAYLEKLDVVSLTETSANAAFARDGSRVAPHNLYVSIRGLYRSADAAEGADLSPPDPVFAFSDEVETASKRARTASITFSFASAAEWTWSHGHWIRLFGGEPLLLEDGEPIAVANVLVQEVVVGTGIGSSPDVTLTGSGRAWLLRDGRLVLGRWTRSSLDDVTRFSTRSGDELTLAPGTTFVELVPKETGEVSIGR